MDADSIKVSMKRKLAILQRVHLLASMTEEYHNDKKMLAALDRTLKKESKKLAETKYPLSDDDANTLTYLLAEVADIVKRFQKAKKLGQFRMARTALDDCFTRIEQEIMATGEPVEKKDAKSGGSIEEGGELNADNGKNIEEGAEKLKNA